MKEIFTNLIYENERDIFTSYKETYPSEFSDYLDLFKLINYDDICTYSDEGNKNKEDCKSVSKGILEKGLRTSIVSLAESIIYLLFLLYQFVIFCYNDYILILIKFFYKLIYI